MTTTNEPEVIAELRGWHGEGAETLFAWDVVLCVDIADILAAYDAIVSERDEWRDAATWVENQQQHWKTVAEAATAQRDAAVRERDALRHELEIAQTTVLVERDYIEQVRSERDAAVRERGELRQRVQVAEKMARVTIDECRRQGVSLGRSLANYAATEAKQENDTLRAERDAAVRAAAAWKRSAKLNKELWSDEKEVHALRCYDVNTLRARLAACERVVEAARAVVLDAWKQHGYDQYNVGTATIAALRAAVAAETCERSSPITAGDTQGDK